MNKIKWFFRCLLIPREYSRVNGELYVREGFRKPVNVINHLKYDHKLSNAEINDLFIEADEIIKHEDGKTNNG